MEKIKVRIWEKEEYDYKDAFGFIPFIQGYLHETDEIRPAMIIVPGGGYVFLSPTEADLIARKFYDFGFQVFVCIYTVNTLLRNPLDSQPMWDLARAIQTVRSKEKEWKIDREKIIVFGASAGGHLVGSLSVHFHDLTIKNCRPDAVILAYPVVSTAPQLIHKASFKALLGNEPSKKKLEYMSIEKNVSSDMPPCFIWHTMTDSEVSVQNSLTLARACSRRRVLSACHIFSEGDHGMALADGSIESRAGEGNYVFEQQEKIKEAVRKGKLVITEEERNSLERVLTLETPVQNCKENRQVSRWTELVMDWLYSFLL